jgi:hypothetical protein
MRGIEVPFIALDEDVYGVEIAYIIDTQHRGLKANAKPIYTPEEG